MWKQIITDYFHFTKRERTGLMVLLSLLLFFIILPYFFPLIIKEKRYDYNEFESAIASLKPSRPDSKAFTVKGGYKNRYESYHPGAYQEASEIEAKATLFHFDPNTATAEDWERLGVKEKTVATIHRYLSKGGKFYKKEDIGKIWGLPSEQVKRLLPYVEIKDHRPEAVSAAGYERKPYKKALVEVNINLADSAELENLPGIGSKLSMRIINFREKLGGFHDVAQVAETFGLPDSTFQKIRPLLTLSAGNVKRININVATIDELKAHPYIRYRLANPIVQYRNQHGHFTTVRDLEKIMIISETELLKMAPYLTIE